jgi:hypothetical protein
MARYGILIAAMAALAAFAGSCAPPKGLPPSPARTGAVHFDAAWDAAVAVLWEYGFTVDRMDRRSGLITTAPLTGKYLGEFWRHDAATNRDVWEGTTQTIYRQATVHLVPVGATTASASGPATYPTSRPSPDTPFVARVEIHVSRSDRPLRQIESTGDAQRMFLKPQSADLEEAAVHKEELARKREEPNYNVDLGRDAKLEAIIEGKINDRAILGTPPK